MSTATAKPKKRVIPMKTPEQVIADHAGESVFVYFNLHKKVWSVKSRTTGRVLCHTTTVTLSNATGKISESGRQRVIREKRKNVHAGITGTISEKPITVPLMRYRHITYNPYKYDSFVYLDDDTEKFDGADYVELGKGYVRAHNAGSWV